MARKITGNIVLLLFPILFVVFYYLYYETTGNEWSVQCTFYDITGWQCPGCGGQRAFHYLLHGEVLTALRHNLMVVLIVPMALYCYWYLGQIYVVRDREIGNRFSIKPWHAYAFLIALFVFFVLRNIPLYPFTLLSPP